jgi:hypothetical protein
MRRYIQARTDDLFPHNISRVCSAGGGSSMLRVHCCMRNLLKTFFITVVPVFILSTTDAIPAFAETVQFSTHGIFSGGIVTTPGGGFTSIVNTGTGGGVSEIGFVTQDLSSYLIIRFTGVIQAPVEIDPPDLLSLSLGNFQTSIKGVGAGGTSTFFLNIEQTLPTDRFGFLLGTVSGTFTATSPTSDMWT